jgi:hypothetical protein
MSTACRICCLIQTLVRPVAAEAIVFLSRLYVIHIRIAFPSEQF